MKKDTRIMVEKVLENIPATRNNDKLLTIEIWKQYYPEHIQLIEGKVCIKLESLYDLPSQDDIKRIRARVQNDDHKFLPTTWEIAKRRRIAEDEWRKYLGYQPKLGI